ncbi:von willebrand factor type a [Leptolyngbya sp. Heron Island J]|uniref:vWA domain-containing protein n=1 Tax=Leptolyngbya sp. Heron Island J TaxID=1385935 RepID=UPI0003B9AFE4|nr:VWA domain-containing protein [Leptolyngbya sp. Heron Island J]ESA33007.1 von willebrand factor type a [Leptolyngbya sp. Heron Island J]
MKANVQWSISDRNLDTAQTNTQRHLAIAVQAASSKRPPLNLCLILDQSGSMGGAPIKNVRAAAQKIIDNLSPQDRISIVSFDHKAQVVVPNQLAAYPDAIKQAIEGIRAGGGTAIDEGLKRGIEEVAKGKTGTVSQIFLLTDGENEHGDNDRCLKLAQLAVSYSFTVSTLGFGDHWNQDVLEKLADAGNGSLTYIQNPDTAIQEFSRLFSRVQSVSLTNAYLVLTLQPQVRLAELKPIAQVLPETIELDVRREGEQAIVRLGDLMNNTARVILVNLYIAQLPAGNHPIVHAEVQYDDPTLGSSLSTDKAIIDVTAQTVYQSQSDPQVQQYILALAKYRQTQIAETKLQAGDRTGAITMLQSATQTALQMGDQTAATVLQENVTQLQTGQDLSEQAKKKTRIASKTILQ